MNNRQRFMSLRQMGENHPCNTCTSTTCSILTHCKNSIEAFSAAKKKLVFEKDSRLNKNLNDGLYLLSNGKLKIYKTGKYDEEIILSFVKPGEIFSILRSDENDEYPFQIGALEDSAICFVDVNAFRSMSAKDPLLMMSLYKMQYEQLRKIQSRYFNTMCMNVSAKVADALITMYEAYGIDSEGNLDVKLSRLEIAGLATTTKEQVSKVISEFKSAGIIKSKAKKIAITDFTKLKAAAGI